MAMQHMKQWATKGSNLLQALLFVLVAASFSACGGDDDYYKSPCYPSAEEKLAQKEVDIKVIKKYFRQNDIDTTSMKTTESGIHYFNLTQGTGAEIKAGNLVEVHYLGKHLDGPTFDQSTKFDSSYGNAQGFQFIVGAKTVIAGWDEALQLMKVGEETRFYIPSYLAYGPCGSGSIAPNEILVFDIKVLRAK